MEEGYKDSEKDMEKTLGAMRLSAEEYFLTKENKARQHYECMFNLSCRQAEKEKRDLWEYLSAYFMLPEERHLIKPPDTLKNKKRERKLWLKKEFWPYFHECTINCFYSPFIKIYSTGVLSSRKKGEKTGKKATIKSNARRKPIIEESKELMKSGVEKHLIKRTAQAFPDETYDYVQKAIKKEKDRNGSS